MDTDTSLLKEATLSISTLNTVTHRSAVVASISKQWTRIKIQRISAVRGEYRC